MRSTHDVRGAIVGLGLSEMGRDFDRTANELAAEAVARSAADAGIGVDAIDGLLLAPGLGNGLNMDVHRVAGLGELGVAASVQAYGASAGIMIQHAVRAIAEGQATTIACVFADTPLRAGHRAGSAFNNRQATAGFDGIRTSTRVTGPNVLYALAARRHMCTFGTTSDDFGAIAVAQRSWAALNPLAQQRKPLNLTTYHSARLIADPFRLFDCCLVTNGAIAVLVSSVARSRDMGQPAVHVLGWGQAHERPRLVPDERFGLFTAAERSGPAALSMAGLRVDDIDLVQLYDCYTYTVLVTLEDYGFCPKGEGGEFVSQAGLLGPKGRFMLNTGGGQLSAYYMWGMTPLSEAVIQLRGQAGDRQCDRHDTALVSGNGGILQHHSTLVLGRGDD